MVGKRKLSNTMDKYKKPQTDESSISKYKSNDEYQPSSQLSSLADEESSDMTIETTQTTYNQTTLEETDSESQFKPPFSIDEYQLLLKEEFCHKNTTAYKRCQKQLTNICNSLEEKKITLTKILQSDLLECDKQRAVELYGVLSQMSVNSFPYIELSKFLEEMIGSSIIFKPNPELNEQVLAIQNKILAETPTLQSILSAKLSEADKMIAIQLYQTFYQEGLIIGGLYSERWFSMRQKLIDVLTKSTHDPKFDALEEELKSERSQQNNTKHQILSLQTTVEVKRKLYDMFEQLNVAHDDQHKEQLSTRLKWLTELPYQKLSTVHHDINTFCFHVYNQLNAKMFGMQNVKERLLLHLHNRLYQKSASHILALEGAPGVGKTKIIQCFAEAVGRYYDKISLGGQIDSSIFCGSNGVWLGAEPSMILRILRRAKTADPIIALDEIDKIGESYKGIEVTNSLLHIIDPQQMTTFNDAYLNEFPHDISHVWFFAAMNDAKKVEATLRDRMDIIHVESYTKEQQMEIIVNYTLPQTCEKCGLRRNDLSIDRAACHQLLLSLSADMKQTGMRAVEKVLYEIVSKIHFLTLNNKDFNLSFKLSDFGGFPYEINKKTIKQLVTSKDSDTNYKMMYI